MRLEKSVRADRTCIAAVFGSTETATPADNRDTGRLR